MPKFNWNKIDKTIIKLIVELLQDRANEIGNSNLKVYEEIKGWCWKIKLNLDNDESATLASQGSKLERLEQYLITSDTEKIRNKLILDNFNEITNKQTSKILNNPKLRDSKKINEQPTSLESNTTTINNLLLQVEQIEEHIKQLTESNTVLLNKELVLKANAEKTINLTEEAQEQQSSSNEIQDVEIKSLEEDLKTDLSDEYFNWNQIKPKALQILAELKFNELCQNRETLEKDLKTLSRDCFNQIEQQIALVNQIKIEAEQARETTSIPADLQNQFNEILFPEDIETWKNILSKIEFETGIDFEAIKNYLIQQSKLNSCSMPKDSTTSLSDTLVYIDSDSEYDSDELLYEEESDASDCEITDLTF